MGAVHPGASARKLAFAMYSFSGVIHRRSGGHRLCSATETVSNAVAMTKSGISFLQNNASKLYFGCDSGTNLCPSRWTSIAQTFDRSRNPNADTHSQVMTPNVPHYTACAPRSSNNDII